MVIRELVSDDELTQSAVVISESFGTVAREMGLTPENCPTNPAFITPDKVLELRGKGLRCFGLFIHESQAGFCAIENAGGGVYYLEKLAVLPGFRHQGCGGRLLDFAVEYAKKAGGNKISIALVDENRLLKQWYLDYGFVETGTKKFPHLPFTVCFMEKAVG